MASQPGLFNFQALTNFGDLAAGFRLYTYAPSTTTQKNAFTDQAGTIPHTYTADGAGGQYIALDARGELPAPLWLASGGYDIALKTPAGVTVWTRRAVGTEDAAVASVAALTADLASTATGEGAALIGFLQAGTGAVARTSLAKERESLTPDDMGCVGDGVADDGAAFLLALASAVATGRALSLRPGAVYKLTSYSAFSNTGPLVIIGNGATIQGPGGAVDFLSPAANFTIDGARFTNWRSVVNRLLAQSGSMTEVRFTNNWVTVCNGICINIERPVESYWIEGNSFENCTGGYGVRIGENTFANQDTWVRGWVRANRFRSLSATGAVSAVAILIYGREVTISDNKIDGVTQSGTGESWGIYTKVRYGQVMGNTVQNVTSASNTDLVGINIKGNTRGITSAPQGFANIVIGNHVRNIGVAGVRGGGIRGQTDDVLISGNQCEDCGTTGIVADETAVHRNVAISGNLVRYASAAAGTVGIRLEGQGTGDSADHNRILNAETGIVVRTGPTGTMADSRVASNLIAGCTFNLVFDSFTGCTLSRLVIDDNVMTGGTFGILYNGSAGTVTGLRLRNNDLARAATPISGALGTSPVVSGNSGFLSASATWDPPSIANGASSATSLTVGGAVVGDMVSASFSNALGGLSLTAQVSAPDAVEVRLSNASGGAVDLASGTVRVTVSKGLA